MHFSTHQKQNAVKHTEIEKKFYINNLMRLKLEKKIRGISNEL